MGNCLSATKKCLCPCLIPGPVYEPVNAKQSLQTTVMVVGNIAVGKSSLIKCLVSGKTMRGVDI